MLQRLVGVLDLLQLQLELDHFVDTVVQIFFKLCLDQIKLFPLVVELLLNYALGDLVDIGLLFLQHVINGRLQSLYLLLLS